MQRKRSEGEQPRPPRHSVHGYRAGGPLPDEAKHGISTFNCPQGRAGKGQKTQERLGAGGPSQKQLGRWGSVFRGDDRGSRCLQAEDVASPKTRRPDHPGGLRKGQGAQLVRTPPRPLAPRGVLWRRARAHARRGTRTPGVPKPPSRWKLGERLRHGAPPALPQPRVPWIYSTSGPFIFKLMSISRSSRGGAGTRSGRGRGDGSQGGGKCRCGRRGRAPGRHGEAGTGRVPPGPGVGGKVLGGGTQLRETPPAVSLPALPGSPGLIVGRSPGPETPTFRMLVRGGSEPARNLGKAAGR